MMVAGDHLLSWTRQLPCLNVFIPGAHLSLSVKVHLGPVLKMKTRRCDGEWEEHKNRVLAAVAY